eukprot:5344311-Amphidinium_carterae.1
MLGLYMRSFKSSLRRAAVDSFVVSALDSANAHGSVREGAALKSILQSLSKKQNEQTKRTDEQN